MLHVFTKQCARAGFDDNDCKYQGCAFELINMCVLVQLRKEFARVKRERQRVKDRLAELNAS